MPRLATRLLAYLIPPAERDEVIVDLETEHAERTRRDGPGRATVWLWTQLLRSTPALLRRSWSRGTTGFDPRANVMNPGGPLMERWILEARHAARRLRTRPAYSTLAVVTLAIGVAGLAAIAGIVRPLLVDPLPYPRADQLAQLWRPGDWRAKEITTLRGQWSGFSAVAAYRPADVTLEREGEPARVVPGIAATTELFSVLGVQPLLGRGFARGEDGPLAQRVAVLSYDLWRELGADQRLVGKTLKLDGAMRTVIGVMPPGFWFPDPSVGVWTTDSLAPDGGIGLYTLVARVAPGHRVDHMQPALDRATRLLASRFSYTPEWDITKHAALTPLRDAMVGDMHPMLFATLAGMGVILLIACANVTALVLGQVESRSTELAVRAALGADRARIAAQITIETLVLGLIAGVVGSGVAVGGFDMLRQALPLGVWRDRATLDWTLFASAIAVAMISSLAIALLPVLSLSRRDLQVSLAGARTSGVLRRGGLQSPMVVAEVALAALLVTAAGLLARSVSALYAVHPGIETRGVAVFDVAAPMGAASDDRRSMLQNAVRELARIPGVRSAALTQRLPLRGPGWSMGLRLPGVPVDAPEPRFRIVSRDYFATLGIPVVRGRAFDVTDRATDSIMSIVVNEALVELYFPKIDPIGHVFLGGWGKPERVVGVVANVAEGSLSETPPPARYYLADQVPFVPGGETIVLRTSRAGDAARILAPARKVIAATSPGLAVQEATTMSRVLDGAVGPARDLMGLLGLLTALALLLGAVGIYGVISQFVARRRREWSIRVALGLAPARVIGLIVRHGLALVTVGIAVGVAGALVSTRLLSSFLFGVTARDPVTLAGAVVVLLGVGTAAALVPALRAGRTDPALVLREQ